ncbi:MAG: hypothetical protein WA919_08620 [Coleofasciculaceae cyanobacterium]
MLKPQALAGASLAILVAGFFATPAFANPVSKPAQEKLISQMESEEAVITGTIEEIVDDVVTVKTADDETQDIRISQIDQRRLGLEPGSRIMAQVVMMEGQELPVVRAIRIVDLAETPSEDMMDTDTTSTQQERTVETQRIRSVQETRTRQTVTTEETPEEMPEEMTQEREEPAEQPAVRALW